MFDALTVVWFINLTSSDDAMPSNSGKLHDFNLVMKSQVLVNPSKSACVAGFNQVSCS